VFLPKPDYNLEIGSGSHAEQTANAMIALERTTLKERPRVVLVEGDTNTVLAGGLTAVSNASPPIYVAKIGFPKVLKGTQGSYAEPPTMRLSSRLVGCMLISLRSNLKRAVILVEKIPSWLERLLLPRFSSLEGELKAFRGEAMGEFRAVHARVDSLEKETSSLRSEMNTRLSSLESTMSARLNSLESEMDTKLDALKSAMSARFDALESKVTLVEAAN
jgi:hypothetical protein